MKSSKSSPTRRPPVATSGPRSPGSKRGCSRRAPGVGGAAGPRLLGLAELSDVRDALVSREAAEREARTADANSVAYHRNLLEEAFTDPRRHRGLRIPLKALGEPGCGVYQVKPRLGIVGMLAGWWEITLSSGCP